MKYIREIKILGMRDIMKMKFNWQNENYSENKRKIHSEKLKK